MADASAPLAFAAGAASFLSPCVLPIVPGYLSYMSGVGASEDKKSVRATGAVALGFVLGFSAVFVALGASVTLLGSFLRDYQRQFTIVAGLLIILMGLIFMGVLKIPFFYREARFHPSARTGFWGSIVIGSAFGFGWSPCIGPTLGLALTMAAGGTADGSPAQGALLLAIYSLGLGVPFIVAGLGFTRLTGAMGWLRQRIRVVNIAAGVILIVIGVLFVSDKFYEMSRWAQEWASRANIDFWSSF